MHLTNRLSSAALGIVLVGMAFGGLVATGVGAGQEERSRPARGAPEVAPAPRPNLAAPPSGDLLVVPIGTSKRLQMKSKRPIATVVNQKENIAVVQPVIGDPTMVQVTGREAGMTHITLTDTDGTEEGYDVSVQLDVEFLRAVLRRAVPTASLDITPAANGAVILSGTVTRTEDIDIILRTAATVVGAADRVINAMRVGGLTLVQLDVVIAQVNRSELRELSFEFLTQGSHHTFVSALETGTAPGSIGAVGSGFTGNASIGTSANVALSLFNLKDAESFLAFLQALRTENVSKLLAEPHLVTASGHSAFFNSGGEQAVPQISGGGGAAVAGVQFVPFGTQISFLPIVLGDGKIYLEVAPKVSIPVNDPLLAAPISGASGGESFGRQSQEVHTTAVIEDGQTLVVGGLIQNLVTGSTNKLPILGDLPFIGAFFSSKSFSETEQELIILITPHLVDPMACRPKYLPGQETRSPDDFELFLEGILEAPRGPREVCVDGHYVPAYKNGPAADFPRHSAGPGGPPHGTSDAPPVTDMLAPPATAPQVPARPRAASPGNDAPAAPKPTATDKMLIQGAGDQDAVPAAVVLPPGPAVSQPLQAELPADQPSSNLPVYAADPAHTDRAVAPGNHAVGGGSGGFVIQEPAAAYVPQAGVPRTLPARQDVGQPAPGLQSAPEVHALLPDRPADQLPVHLAGDVRAAQPIMAPALPAEPARDRGVEQPRVAAQGPAQAQAPLNLLPGQLPAPQTSGVANAPASASSGLDE